MNVRLGGPQRHCGRFRDEINLPCWESNYRSSVVQPTELSRLLPHSSLGESGWCPQCGGAACCWDSLFFSYMVTYVLGYGYIGARPDTTQQTNICLGIHCRNMWLHLNRRPFCPLQRHSNPMRTAASIWPDCRLETISLCLRQTVGGDNIPDVSVSV